MHTSTTGTLGRRSIRLGWAICAGAMLAALPTTVAGQAPSRDEPSPTPFTVAPRLLNIEDVQRALVDAYPTELRRTGIGGRVQVWFFIDRDGRVDNALVAQSSGISDLDEAALSVAWIYTFSPAMNRSEPVPVWVSLPITFQVRPR